MSKTSLQLKLELLRTLKTGNIDKIDSLISQISSVTKINPELYDKFNTFVKENKQGLKEMVQEQKMQNEPCKIILQNVDGDLDEKEYDSDQSLNFDSDQEQAEQTKNVTEKVFKQARNKTTTKVTADNVKKVVQKAPTNPQLAFKKTTLQTKPIPTQTNPIKKTK